MKVLSFLFASSIGRKLVMGVTGLSLVGFLLVHCGINACIFVNDGGELFNSAAEFMSNNFFIRLAEVGLFVGLILHVIQGIWLTLDNQKKRKAKYGKSSGNANSKWYSRSMGLLGTIILIFLILHLKHFWVLSRFTDHISSGQETLFQEMKEIFEEPWIVGLYVLGCISLAYHLLHGFWSAFKTIGLEGKNISPIIHSVGVGFSIIVPLIFALMPIAMHFEWIK